MATDVALENAKARREALQARLSKIDADIQELEGARERAQRDLRVAEAFITIWYEMAGIQPPEQLERKESSAPADQPPRPKNPDRLFVAQQCVTYIREAGRPLGRRELFERLVADGIHIRGKDAEMVLSTMLWRSREVIVRLKEGGYWPAHDPLPTPDLEKLIN